MRVIGIDPGSGVTGFGLVEDASGGRFVHVAAGTIRATALGRGAARLLEIHRRLLMIIAEHAPAAMSLEKNFIARNVQSAFRIGEARAVAMLAAAECSLPLFEYTPNQVKLAVAAYGHADKAQVKFMVRRTLNLAENGELADDAADALALAICHLGRHRIPAATSAAAKRAHTLSPGGAARWAGGLK